MCLSGSQAICFLFFFLPSVSACLYVCLSVWLDGSPLSKCKLRQVSSLAAEVWLDPELVTVDLLFSSFFLLFVTVGLPFCQFVPCVRWDKLEIQQCRLGNLGMTRVGLDDFFISFSPPSFA